MTIERLSKASAILAIVVDNGIANGALALDGPVTGPAANNRTSYIDNARQYATEILAILDKIENQPF